MTPPLLQPVPRQPGARSTPAVPGVETFLVVREGVFDGRVYGAGELVLCRGEARNGDATVLVALGQGRPRLGTRRNGRWHGDVGEPCAPERWRSAGRLVGRSRRVAGAWVVDLFADDAPSAVPARAETQLSLFAA